MTDPIPIFLIDDDEAVRQGLGALLAAKGFAVETFASAEAFLAALPTAPSGCIVADIRCPA